MKESAQADSENIFCRLIGFLLLAAVLSGCGTFAAQISGQSQAEGKQAETIISPSGRYTAQIGRCCDFYDYISTFEVFDNQTNSSYRQNLNQVDGLSATAGGVFFNWTPSERYLVITTDNRVTSHGCDEVLIYDGDGSELVYNSSGMSICTQGLMADAQLSEIELCDNDDVIYVLAGKVYRLTPATGQKYEIPPMTCDE